MKTVLESIQEYTSKAVTEEIMKILERKIGDDRAVERMLELSTAIGPIKSVLGYGQEGICVLGQNGIVYKIYYSTAPLSVSMLAAACATGYEPKTLPVVSKINDWCICRENYKTKTQRCRDWVKGVRGYHKEKKIVSAEMKQWCEDANYELSEIGAPPLYQADIKLDNFGERKGKIVLLDF